MNYKPIEPTKKESPTDHAPEERPIGEGLVPVFVRATPAEKARIKRRAKACKMSTSRYLAKVGAEGRFPPSAEEREDLRALRLSLAGIAQALGVIASRLELARRGREVDVPSPDEILSTTKMAKSISQAIARRLKL